MITIIDNQMGNIKSISNMLKKIGYKSHITYSPTDVLNAQKLILPGVGAFDTGMKNLKSSGLYDALNDAVIGNKTPILGICLGMQLLTRSSEEGVEPGLGWIEADIKKFQFNPTLNLKVPHMGWNFITPTNNHPLLLNLPENPKFYFVHSFHAVCPWTNNVIGNTHYGYDFASVIGKDNILGVQFHPEKSHKYGMQLLKNFAEM